MRSLEVIVNKINNGQTSFEKVIVDADKFLLTAAQSVQEAYIIATNKRTGVSKEFEGVSKFWGLGKKVGGWLKEMNELFGLNYTKEDWEIEECFRLRTDITDHLAEAEKIFSYNVGAIKRIECAEDYALCLGGEGNFRYEVGKLYPYKFGRKEKPIIFEQLKESVFRQYKNKIIVANGYESDDTLAMMYSESIAQYMKTGVHKYILAFVDKDLKMLATPWLHLDDLQGEIKWIERFDAAHHFCYQLLAGDKTCDGILGVVDVPNELKAKYGLRKGKGCGSTTAEGLLMDVKTIPKLFERVIECYKSQYPEPVTFTDHRGDEYTYDWKDHLVENAKLLWMHRSKDEIENWSILKLLKQLKIDVDKIGEEV